MSKNVVQPASEIWYLREWFAATDRIQRDLVTQLDYAPGTAFKLWHGYQFPHAEHIRDIAALLNIEPFELLMPPEQAMRDRTMRKTLAELAVTKEEEDRREAIRAHRRAVLRGDIRGPDKKAG